MKTMTRAAHGTPTSTMYRKTTDYVTTTTSCAKLVQPWSTRRHNVFMLAFERRMIPESIAENIKLAAMATCTTYNLYITLIDITAICKHSGRRTMCDESSRCLQRQVSDDI